MTGARRGFAGVLAVAVAVTVAGCAEPKVKPGWCGHVADAHSELEGLRQEVAYTSVTDVSYKVTYEAIEGDFQYLYYAVPAVEKREAFAGQRAATRASIFAHDGPQYRSASARVDAVLAHFDALC